MKDEMTWMMSNQDLVLSVLPAVAQQGWHACADMIETVVQPGGVARSIKIMPALTREELKACAIFQGMEPTEDVLEDMMEMVAHMAHEEGMMEMMAHVAHGSGEDVMEMEAHMAHREEGSINISKSFKSTAKMKKSRGCSRQIDKEARAGDPKGQDFTSNSERVRRPLRRKKTSGPGLCFEFRKGGKCEFGEKCRFKHGEEDTRDLVNIFRKYRGVCFQFRDNGTCKYGDKCRYNHGLS